MPKYCIEFSYSQVSRGTATITARSLAHAQAIADEMDTDDGRIDFTPIDGTLYVTDVEKA